MNLVFHPKPSVFHDNFANGFRFYSDYIYCDADAWYEVINETNSKVIPAIGGLTSDFRKRILNGVFNERT